MSDQFRWVDALQATTIAILSQQINDLALRIATLETLLRASTSVVYLKDGVAAPATVVGLAHIYVDTADGDLKIKFGDGTIKTIVTDT